MYNKEEILRKVDILYKLNKLDSNGIKESIVSLL